MKKLLLYLLCFALLAPAVGQRTTRDSQSTTTSGSHLDFDNDIGSVTVNFEVVITGSPSTVSMVFKGCMKGAATCDTLTTSTATSSSNIQPNSSSVVYDYYDVTPSWTGGTAVKITVGRYATTARGGGGGITNGAGSNVFPLSNGTNLITSPLSNSGGTATYDPAGTAQFNLYNSGVGIEFIAAGTGNNQIRGSGTTTALAFGIGGSTQWNIDSGGNWAPNSDAFRNIGDATHRVINLFLSGSLTSTATANGITFATFKRFTDTSPTGNFENFQNAAAGSLWTVDITGSLTAGVIPAARVSSGTLAAAQMPALTGDVTSSAGAVATTLAAGNAGNLNSGTLLAARMPALTGDCTTSAGAVAVTCTQINGANFTVNTSGLPTKVDGITTAGQGVAIVQCITSAKTETGADAAVLSCTPAAAVGSYDVCVAIDVSAANTATLGWTATWTNSKGNANAPTNMHLFQMGVAAPALTFTAAANNSYYACVPIAVNNAGTAIVVKTTFSGTSIAYNVTATIKRII